MTYKDTPNSERWAAYQVKLGRKWNADTKRFSGEVFEAVLTEMKRRRVCFLPASVVKKVARTVTRDKLQVSHAATYYQGGLGIARNQ